MSEIDQDDLLKRAKKVQSETEQASSEKQKRFGRNFFWSKLKKNVPEQHASKLKVVEFIFSCFKKAYNLYQWMAYEHVDGQLVLDSDDSPIFSGKRLTGTSSAIIAGLFAIHASLSAAYYYSTTFSETVYVTGKQEIVTGELYQFGGCTSLPCSTATDNGKFYLIESSFYFPRLFYPEQEVYANIPQQNAACEISGYGIYFRNFRWLYKSAQLYQHVTDVSCRPYTKDELELAVENGSILKKI